MTGAPRFSFRLAALALRRALAPGVLAWAALLALALATNDGNTDAIAIDMRDDRAVPGVLARPGLWSGFCLALMPVLVIRAAGAIGWWRARGEVDWLGSRAISRVSVASSTVSGMLAGAWILVYAWLLLVSLRIDPVGSYKFAGTIAAPGAVWIDGTHARSWRATVPHDVRRSVALARVELGLGAGAGAATEVVLEARGGGTTSSARARIATRGTIEVALPRSASEVELELSVTDPAARVLVLSDATQVWRQVDEEGGPDHAIARRLCVAACAWIALAFGLGAWISAPSAALCVFALWIAVWLGDPPGPWIPGVDLPQAMDIVAEGRVPGDLDPRQLAGALVAFALGIALAVTGLARWRRET